MQSYSTYDREWVETAISRLATAAPPTWTADDFGDAVDAEQWRQNVRALLFDFMADRRQGAGVPLARSEMARVEFGDLLYKQFSSGAGFAPERSTRVKKQRPKQKHSSRGGAAAPGPTLSLIPRRETLDGQLARHFNLFNSEPYQGGSVMELLPEYLHFLARLGVVHPAEMDAALLQLKPLTADVLKLLTGSGADLQLLDAVEQAWANSALLTIRDDPALAAARASPQPAPRKAAASPLASATSARFKVTYRRTPQAWFVIDLPTRRSLNDLHRAIQDAAEFDDDHMYAFFLSGEAWDKDSEYAPQGAPRPTSTRLGELPLRMKQSFLYLFDYGGEHHFEVQLIAVDAAPMGKEPYHIAESHGTMPSQYGEYDDEDEEDLDPE